MIKASHILKLAQSYLPRKCKDQEEKSSAIRKVDSSPKSFQRRLDNRMEDDHYWESFFEPTEKGTSIVLLILLYKVRELLITAVFAVFKNDSKR